MPQVTRWNWTEDCMEQDPEYGDFVPFANYDALAARLAEAERLLCEAEKILRNEYGDPEKATPSVRENIRALRLIDRITGITTDSASDVT